MKRTSFISRLIFAALIAILPGCGEEGGVCQLEQRECSSVCVNLATDPNNCGLCSNACGTAMTCVVGECVPAAAICTLPEERCGESGCVNTQTSAAHCGTCDAACSANADCVTGECAEPLAVMQTSLNDRELDRDLFVLNDVTFQLTKINTATFFASRVIDHVVLPDGSLILVAAETEDVFELYHASPRGGALTKLNPTLVSGGDVLAGLAVSRDGSKVLYRADQDTDGVIDLYAVTLANPGASVKVNGALVTDGSVSRVFEVSADGSRAAYVADQDIDGLDEAFVVDLSTATPGASTKLNPPLVSSSIFELKLSSDGTKVVYRADHDVPGAPQLYVVDVASPGVANRIANPDGADYQADAYLITPDSLAVIYTGGTGFFQESLWRVPLVAPPLDSTLLVDGGEGFSGVRPDLAISDDSVRVYFRKRNEATNLDQVFRVNIAFPDVVTLLSSPDDSVVADTDDFVLSADEQSLVFRTGGDGGEGGNPSRPGTEEPDQNRTLSPALFHVDLTVMTPPTLLSPPPGKSEGIGSRYFATNDRRALYRADHDVPGHSDVYLATVAAPGVVTKVSPPLDRATDSTDVSILSGFRR